MEQKVETRGNRMDADKKAAVLECIAQGIGYMKAVPILIEKGFVDSEGNCTVNKGSFDFLRKQSDSAKISINCTRAEFDWAKAHEKEILTYIRTRMQME